jgi:molybdenum cofactor synthesis domain-containing protein
MNASPISFEEARSQVLANCRPIERSEAVAASSACGRVLSGDVMALMPVPRFSRSAMDGYAVRDIDTAGANDAPVRLRLKGSVYASEMPHFEILPGECARVSTGATMPSGADAVVRVEDTDIDGDTVIIRCPVREGECVSAAGSDIKAGRMLFAGGTVLDPARIGALASQGISSIEVYARPRVAVISTGDELTEPGYELKEGHIYDINTSSLSALIGESGGIPLKTSITADTVEALTNSLKVIFSADMVVISGGSSVGEKDYIQEVLSSLGTLIFHSVRIKPGQPTAFAVVKGKPVIALPGPPTACLMNAYLLMVPAIHKLARLPLNRSSTLRARVGDFKPNTSRSTKSFPVRMDGDMAVSTFKKSGDILCTAKADGYIIMAEGREDSRDEVLVTLF